MLLREYQPAGVEAVNVGPSCTTSSAAFGASGAARPLRTLASGTYRRLICPNCGGSSGQRHVGSADAAVRCPDSWDDRKRGRRPLAEQRLVENLSAEGRSVGECTYAVTRSSADFSRLMTATSRSFVLVLVEIDPSSWPSPNSCLVPDATDS